MGIIIAAILRTIFTMNSNKMDRVFNNNSMRNISNNNYSSSRILDKGTGIS